MRFSTPVSVAGILTLSACNGTSFEDALTSAIIQTAIEDRAETYSEILTNEEYSDLTTLQPSGTASFSGAAAFVTDVARDLEGQEIVDNADFVSQVAIDVDFDDNDVDGEFTNFFALEDSRALSGSVSIDGTFNRDVNLVLAPSITADLEGELVDEGETSTVTGELTGDFFDNDGTDIVSGFVDGAAENAEGTLDLQGIFIAD